MTEALPESAADAAPLDFDFAMPEPEVARTSAESLASEVMDFSLPEIKLEPEPEPAATPSVDDLDFDLDFGSGANTPIPEAAAESLASAEVAAAAGGQGMSLPEIEVSSAPAANPEDDLEFDVSLTSSTFLGRSSPGPDLDLDTSAETLLAPMAFDMKSIDLDLEAPAAAGEKADWANETRINVETPATTSKSAPADLPAAEAEVEVDPLGETALFDTAQVATSVNPDFLSGQAETIVNPQFGMETELVAPDFELNVNEEVSTKLDLASAYEEMGDIEGARELLQEVIKEGDATQREKAQAILAKIGA